MKHLKIKSGFKLISEMKKHGIWGDHFSYEQYQKLRKITSIEELKSYLVSIGFEEEAKLDKESNIALYLSKKESTSVKVGKVAGAIEGTYALLTMFSCS